MGSIVRTTARRPLAIVAAGALVLSGGAVLRTQIAGAHATSVAQSMKCTLAGDLTVNYAIDHSPETVESGKPVTMTVKPSIATAMPAALAGIGVSGLTIDLPLTAEIAGATATVTDGSGNFTLASSSVAGGQLTLQLAAGAGVSVANMNPPELKLALTLKSGIEGQTIAIAGPSQFKITTTFIAATGAVIETCTAAAANGPLVTLPVAGTAGVTTTTVAGATTTTVAGAATTTTRAGATTNTTAAGATTTTSRAAATTTTRASATTTTRAAAQPTDTAGEITTAVSPETAANPARPVVANPSFTG